MITINLLIQRIITSLVTIYDPKYDLGDYQKDNFYDIPIHIIIHIIIRSKLREKEVVVITGDFNGHFRSNAEAGADTAFQRG